jgi:hypothetical protein
MGDSLAGRQAKGLALLAVLGVLLLHGGCVPRGQGGGDPGGRGGGPDESCELFAEGEVTIHSRPDSGSAVFGVMEPGFRWVVEGRTPDGWWGFEPGVAQAANVGVFRLRWVQGNGAVRLEGQCGGVPEVIGPPAGVCFTMPMGEVSVHSQADPSSELAATMSVGDYAAVLGKSGDWAKVDLSLGNTGVEATGWVPASTLNMNGPCENLPVLEP